MWEVKYALKWSPIDPVLVYESLEQAVTAAVERGLLPCKITKNSRNRRTIPFAAEWCITIEKGK